MLQKLTTYCSLGKIKIFGILGFFLFVGCQPDIFDLRELPEIPGVDGSSAIVGIISDDQGIGQNEELYHISKVFDYTKVPFAKENIQTFNQQPKIGSKIRVLLINNLAKLNETSFEKIINFIAEGGTLILTKPEIEQDQAFLLGMKPEEKKVTNKTAFGIRFNSAIFPALNKLAVPLDSEVHEGFAGVNFSKDVRILATSQSELSYPLIVENDFEFGRVLLFNSNQGLSKLYRGVIFSLILKGLEGVPYPIANASSVHLDDFPAPLYNIKLEPIWSELGLNSKDYVEQVWWPDMREFASENDITLTAYACFDYNVNSVPPFTFNEWDAFERSDEQGNKIKNSSFLGRDLIANGHEMALHGYNHVSLLKEEWTESDYMVTALQTAMKKWNLAGFGPPPVSYVPPSNYIDSIGMANLKKAIPSIKYIQSVYLGDLDEGGDREFDVDPYANYFFDYPRISSGFNLTPSDIYFIESLYLYTGVWSHFIHPDDVFETPDNYQSTSAKYDFDLRNEEGLNWYTSEGKEGLFDKYKKEFKAFKQRHPLSNFIGSTKASEVVVQWRSDQFIHAESNEKYSVLSTLENNSSSEQFFWNVYVGPSNSQALEQYLKSKELKFIKKSMHEGYLFTIVSDDNLISIPKFNSFNNTQNGVAENKNILITKQDEFAIELEERKPYEIRLENLIGENKIAEAISLFDEALDLDYNFEVKIWQEYLNWTLWQKQPQLFWKSITKAIQKNTVLELQDFGFEQLLNIDNSDAESRAFWFEKALNSDLMYSIKFLDAFIDQGVNDKNQQSFLFALEQRNKLLDSKKNQLEYVANLLAIKPKGYLIQLKDLEPCDEVYATISSGIAYAFSQAEYFEEALQWAWCNDEVDVQSKSEWLLALGRLDEVKKVNFGGYIEHLIINDSQKALLEIEQLEVCDKRIENLGMDVVYLFSNNNKLQKAIDWVNCVDAFNVQDLMTWQYELQAYEQLEKTYLTYITKNQNDVRTKVYMANLYLYRDLLMQAAEIVKEIPNSLAKRNLKNEINKQLLTQSPSYQFQFRAKYSDFFDERNQSKFSRSLRFLRGNDVSSNYNLFTDGTRNVLSEFSSSYTFDNAKNYKVSLGATKSTIYPFELGDDISLTDNEERKLFGITFDFYNLGDYTYDFSSSARLEKDQFDKLYFQFSFLLNQSKTAYFRSVQFDLYPVKTSQGYGQGIYQINAQVGHEFRLAPKLRFLSNLESNIYFDGEADFLSVNQMSYSIVNSDPEKVFFGPLLEVSGGLGSVDYRRGYPYWMDDERFYFGGGLYAQWNIDNKFESNFLFARYKEQGEENFNSLISNISYKLPPYFELTSQVEFFTLEGYNSNNILLGLSYHFK